MAVGSQKDAAGDWMTGGVYSSEIGPPIDIAALAGIPALSGERGCGEFRVMPVADTAFTALLGLKPGTF